jgi:hypothetical protein
MELLAAKNNQLQLAHVCDNDAEILTAAGYEHRNELDRGNVETWDNTRFLECVFDLSYIVGYSAAGAEWIADDSRSAFELVISWAREFHAQFTPEMDERGEYLERLDAFAAAKIAAEQQ